MFSIVKEITVYYNILIKVKISNEQAIIRSTEKLKKKKKKKINKISSVEGHEQKTHPEVNPRLKRISTNLLNLFE